MIVDISSYAWLVPLFPLLAFIMLVILGKQSKKTGTIIAITASTISFILSFYIFIGRMVHDSVNYTWDQMNWLQLGDMNLTMGFEVSNLNTLMLLIVSFVGLMVNFYSIGYMKDDERYNVFFSYIALFTFSMLGLVISINLLQFYIFWELVGVCSFLLVGFWFHKPAAKAAAKKAFIVTRIGDVGLFIAILMLYWYMPNHALDFTSIYNAVETSAIDPTIVTWIAILIFIGAIGKSGQFPLHTWLPDAMEGPTPISALIHAATMVAAGVFLVARTFDLFLASPTALLVVSLIGGFTAIFAAIIATVQQDIKRVLAYSTVSQLGYMMLALGIGTAITNGMFHLFTHAFFKALLFLAVGSAIHALHTQNIHEMGGISKKMKITTWTFAIGALSLIGIPPFSGFWSKDAILTEAYLHQPILFWLGIVTAFLTALYMSRLFFLVFMGQPKQQAEVHESPKVMTSPMIILAGLSVLAGFVQTPFNEWLGVWLTGNDHHEAVNWFVILMSILVGVLGIFVGYLIYQVKVIDREMMVRRFQPIYKLMLNKFYIDEIYNVTIVKLLKGVGMLLHLFDIYVVYGLVRVTSSLVSGLNFISLRAQNGQLQTYGLITLLGLVLLALAIAGKRFINVG
jgi:NADH-quinone oxidoreductase subunit L